MPEGNNQPDNSRPPIYILSGGSGASGEQLVHTVLAQFPDNRLPVIVTGNVRHREQVARLLAEAKERQGAIVYTLVDRQLGRDLSRMAEEDGIVAFDAMGPLLDYLTDLLGHPPLGRPGLYRQLNKEYFDRVSAIEYTIAHDDGKDPKGWQQSEILLAGVSRTGKTPLSIYLSVLGWRVANVPIVPELEPDPALFRLDPHKVVGLTIEPGQLILLRQQRQKRLGAYGPSPYTDPERVHEEVQTATRLFRRSGFSVLDVTDKPIESSADEIIRLITR